MYWSPRPTPSAANPSAATPRAPPLRLGINLIGGANDALPYLIHALTLAGQRGLTRSNSRFQLTVVEQHHGDGQWHPIHTPGIVGHLFRGASREYWWTSMPT